MTAVMFFAGAWGYLRLLKLPVPLSQAAALPAGGGSLLSDRTMLLALAAVMAATVLGGLLVVIRRISPLAAGLPGLLLLGWTALYLTSVRRAVELIPLRGQAFGAGWEALLFNGVLGAAGAVLVMPMFIPSRWRPKRRVAASAAGSEADQYLTEVWPEGRSQWGDEQPGNDEPALVGTVMPYPDSEGPVRPVDTTRVTGASRALRATGSFRTTTGSTPRASGSFRPASDSTLLGRPYFEGPDE